MFKGSPVSQKAPRFPVTVSRIGTPQAQTGLANTTKHPIADKFAGAAGTITPDSPGWLRRVRDSLLFLSSTSLPELIRLLLIRRFNLLKLSLLPHLNKILTISLHR
jgi:hypothetical protein